MQSPHAVCAAVVISLLTVVSAQSKPNFSGKWMTEFVRTTGGSGLGVEITIRQNDTTLTLELSPAGTPPTVQRLSYALDGTESKNSTIGSDGSADERSRVAWSGSTLVITTKTRSGEQKRTFDLDGPNLAIRTSLSGSQSKALVYQRAR